jgi:hypothetical protein
MLVSLRDALAARVGLLASGARSLSLGRRFSSGGSAGEERGSVAAAAATWRRDGAKADGGLAQPLLYGEEEEADRTTQLLKLPATPTSTHKRAAAAAAAGAGVDAAEPFPPKDADSAHADWRTDEAALSEPEEGGAPLGLRLEVTVTRTVPLVGWLVLGTALLASSTTGDAFRAVGPNVGGPLLLTWRYTAVTLMLAPAAL